MYKNIRSWIIIGLTLFVLMACSVHSNATSIKCPAWTGLATDQLCDISQSSYNFESSTDINLAVYEMVTIKIIEGDFLIDNAENIIVTSDDGETVDFELERMLPGTYIVKRDENDTRASFTITNPQSYTQELSVQLEYAKLHDKPTE